MPLRELLALFGVRFDDSQLKKANATIGGTIKSLVALGTALVTGVVVRGIARFIGGQIEIADHINDTSERIGVSTTALQELGHAATLAGVQTGELEGSLQRFVRNIGEAAQGAGPAADTFRELGINVRDAAGNALPAEAVLGQVAEAMAGAESQADRVRIAFDLFGRGGIGMVQVLQGGEAALTAVREEAHALGVVMSEDMIAAAAEADDEIRRFQAALGGLRAGIVVGILPTVTRAAQAFARWLGPISRAFRETDLLRRLLVGGAATAVLVFSRQILGLARSFGRLTIRLLPVAIAFGIIFLAVDDLITLFKGGDSFIGRFIDSIFGAGTAKDVVVALKDAFFGIRDALASVNIDFDRSTFFRFLWLNTPLGLIQKLVQDFREFPTQFSLASAEMLQMSKALLMFFGELGTQSLRVFSDLWKGIVDGFRAAVSQIIALARNLPGASLFGGALGQASAFASGAGRGGIPVTAPGGAGGTASVVQRNTISLSVQAPAGTPAALGSQIGRAITDALGQQHREAAAALQQLID